MPGRCEASAKPHKRTRDAPTVWPPFVREFCGNQRLRVGAAVTVVEVMAEGTAWLRRRGRGRADTLTDRLTALGTSGQGSYRDQQRGGKGMQVCDGGTADGGGAGSGDGGASD